MPPSASNRTSLGLKQQAQADREKMFAYQTSNRTSLGLKLSTLAKHLAVLCPSNRTSLGLKLATGDGCHPDAGCF